MKAGDTTNGRQTYERAADTARRLKSAERLTRAGLGLGEVYQIGVGDELLVAVLEESLRLFGEGERALKAMALGRLAGALYFTGSRGRREGLTRESPLGARRGGE